MHCRRLVLTTLILSLAPAFVRAEPFHYPAGKYGQGELRYVNGLPVLTVEGSPEEIGEQVATLAAKPADRLLAYPKDVMKAFGAGLGWRAMVAVGRSMLPQFPDDHRRELEALVKSGLDRDLVVAGNTMFDIKKLFGCSTFIIEADHSATKGPLFGRNLDFPTLGYLQDYSLVTVYKPTGKHAFVSVGFPGLVGCLSGMNDSGLALAVLEVYHTSEKSPAFDRSGVPYALSFRRVLEECTTVEEAEKLLRSVRRTTRLNLAICDKEHGAVFEITPQTIVVRKPESGFCACTNHFCSPELRPKGRVNRFDTSGRYQELEVRGKSKEVFDLGDLADALNAVNQGEHTLQTMVFEPARLKLHLAIGATPSSTLQMKELDLGPLFAPRSAAVSR
jgi:hypothetical protein